MTGTCPDLLAALHLRMRDLELEQCSVKARVEELRDVIERLEHPQRKRLGRPRKLEAVPPDPPIHVEGGLFTPNTTDPDEEPAP